MLENWLSPVRKKEILEAATEDFQLGRHIDHFRKSSPTLKDHQLAILGIGQMNADAVRKQLYQLDFPFSVKVKDLGNTRKQEVEFLIPLLRELLDSNVLPILIGDTARLALAQYKAFLEIKRAISLTIVDERLPFYPNSNDERFYLNSIINNDRAQLFHLGMIGLQAHFGPQASYHLSQEKNFDLARLGRAKAALPEVEPIIRDADLLSFNLAAIRHTDAPGQQYQSPGGFTHEEACQIARYAGMSDKLRSFGIFGFSQQRDQADQTAQLVAQMIWYFIDGFNSRKMDYPASTEGLIEYIVDIKKLNYQLTFWKSKKSGRWWMQIPVKTKKDFQRHRLIPCSYNDYKLAGQEELPDRLFNALKRFI